MPSAYATDLPDYEPIKRRIQSQFSQQKSEAGDALQRRYAANGMIGSGAYQKQAQIQDDEFAKNQAEAMSNVDFAQAQEGQRRKEIQDTRDFARGEREASQGFARGEREASQGFASGEANKQRLATREMFDADMGFKRLLADREEAWRGLEFDESLYSNYVNTIVALKNADLDWTNIDEYSTGINRLPTGQSLRGGGGRNGPRSPVFKTDQHGKQWTWEEFNNWNG